MSKTTKITYHRDATVTFWDVSAQQWVRSSNPTAAQLASMSSASRERVMRHVDGLIS